MQVTGDLSNYANLSSSASQEQAANKVQTPGVKRDADGDTDNSKTASVTASATASPSVKSKVDVYA